MKRFFFLMFVIFALTGCVEDKPRPEGKVELIPLHVSDVSNVVVEVVSQQKNLSLNIKHHVRNQNVYVECYIPNFSFKEKGGNKVEGEGHLTLYVDGKKVDEMNTAAFIIKGLEKGVHEIKVDVVHNNSTSYNLNKTWKVTVQ